MVAQAIAVVLHIFLCFMCTSKWELGIRGLGIATMLSYFSMFVFVTIYSHCIPSIQKALFWPTKDTFTGWGPYLSIGLPAMVMLMAECWAYQVMGVFAGLISIVDQATNTIIATMVGALFMVPVGIASAATAIIGANIGANQVKTAWANFRVMSVVTMGFMLIIGAIFFFARGPLVRLFTNDEEVAALAESCMYLIVLAFFPDCVQGSIQGVIRALDL